MFPFLQFFQSWPFLFGVTAASIPIILHLIYRRRAPRILFSTLRFLRVSNQRTSARRRIQNLLLLLLRALLLALLAIALAGPFLPSSRSPLLGRSPTSVALVLDNSYSMATRIEGASRFERARELAQGALARLRLGDDAAVLFAAPPRGSPAAALSGDLNEANVRVAKAAVSNARGDLLAAVQHGLKLLAESKNKNRELYIFTDLQKAAWKLEQEDVQAALREHAEIPIILADVGQGTYVNLSIESVDVKAAARVAHAPLVVEAKLVNSSPRTAEQQVSLYVDGGKVDEKAVALQPGSSFTLPFSYVVQAAGTHTGEVRLNDDALAVDNRASFKIETRQQIEALIIRSTGSAVAFYNPDFYLALALNPLGSTADSGTIRPIVADLNALDASALERADVIFVPSAESLTAGALAPIREFVHRGGSAVLFAGEGIDPEALNRALSEGETGTGADAFFPAEFGPPRSAEGFQKPFASVASVETKHPVFAFLTSRELLSPLRLYKWLTVKLPDNSATSALATLDGGDPLLLEHAYGRGKVLFFTTSADTTWTNLPVTNLFLPWMHQLCYWLASSAGARDSYYVGAPVQFPFPDRIQSVAVKVTRPDGVVTQVLSQSTASSNEAVFLDTDLPGIYDYVIGEGEASGKFVVNPDPQEANLTRIAPDVLKAAFGERTVYPIASLEELNRAVDRMREGVALQILLFFIVLALAVLESVASNLSRRRDEGVLSAAPEPRSAEAT